jgi:glycosyltransferase involved in cell wall biosynthesis
LRDGDEIVVVDGGSTDGTLDLLYGTAHSDPRVRVVSAPGTNSPPAATRASAPPATTSLP